MVIYPKDWKRYSFRSFFKLLTNNTLSRDKLSSSGETGDIHYGDILVKYGSTISSSDDIPRIKPDFHFQATDYLQKNDVIIADTAEDETVGKMIQIGDVDFPLVSGLHTIACRPTIETADGYLGYYMNSKCWHDQLLPYIVGTKVSSVSKKSLRETELYLPADISEQRSIVEALAGMDTHIANLTELIEKKKAIRDGALEDLVSGRTRLVGFHGKWICTALNEIAKVYDGTHQTPKYVSSGIRFVSVENINAIYESNKYIKRTDFERDFKVQPIKGDILMTRIGDIGSTCLIESDEPIAYYVSLALLKQIKINSMYLCYAMKGSQFMKELDDRTLHHATPKKINKGEIGKCLVWYPSDPEEQRMIASTLSDMDEEIHCLSVERDKMQRIKAGVMDDLLTGRVRLIG